MSSQFDYCWEVRNRSLKSCIGYATLVTGAINYGFSMVFIDQYIAYSQAVEDNNLESTQCEVASAFGIVTYCSLFQVTLGSITCLIFTLSFCLKFCHALGFICPMFTTMIKKNYNKIPREFNLYESEFDFECFDVGDDGEVGNGENIAVKEITAVVVDNENNNDTSTNLKKHETHAQTTD